jgi:hypothetical protein
MAQAGPVGIESGVPEGQGATSSRASVRALTWWDAPGVVLALVIALPSLSYPLGRDQAVFWYVAREWLDRGAVFYRDVFDHKTPGIYVVHAASMALFGEHVWAVRCVEIPLVLAVGWMAASVVRARLEGAWPPGLYGTGILAASILHFGFLGFWDTAQCEIWCVFFTLAALLALGSRHTGTLRRVIAAGLLVGLALMMKPTSVGLAFVVAVVLWRDRRGGGHTRASLAAFALAAAVPTLLAALYLAYRGAMGDALEVLFGANARYARCENVGGVTDAITRVLDVARAYLPLSLVLVYGTVLEWARARRRRDARKASFYELVLALGAAGLLGACAQLKFYWYHFELMTAGGALAAVALAREGFFALEKRRFSFVAQQCTVVLHLVGLFAFSWLGEHKWGRTARDWVLLETGAIDRAHYAADFRVEPAHFDENANEDVAAWIRSRATPGDELCVRGFDPEIYALSGLRCASRFFWTWWLSEPHRAYHREQWIAEDRDALERSHPRFVVVSTEAKATIEQESYFTAMGYVRSAKFGELVVLERSGGS